MKCDFCEEQLSIKTVYNRIYGDDSRLILDTENFCLVPCLGQLREGHFLAFSKQHFNSAGAMEKDCQEELQLLINKVASYHKNEYHMPTICFEHGVLSDAGNNGGCGISHMHIHLLPGSHSEFNQLMKALAENNINNIASANGISDTSSYISRKTAYIYVSVLDAIDGNESYIITNQSNYFESQYMRKKIAAVIGKEVWDWRSISVPEDDFMNTLSKAKQAFTSD
jgi:diadenosine tetraphosphate (Ap4A) HIT family hydrolase